MRIGFRTLGYLCLLGFLPFLLSAGPVEKSGMRIDPSPAPDCRGGSPEAESGMASWGSKISIRLLGGAGYRAGGDWNRLLDAENRMHRDFAVLYGETVHGEFEQLHFGPDLEAVVMVKLSSRLGVGLAAGCISTSAGDQESRVAVERRAFSEFMTHSSKVRSFPLRIVLSYDILKGHRMNLSLLGGAGYYSVDWSDEYRREWSGLWETVSQKAHGGGFGWDAGLTLSYTLSRHVDILVALQGRYARIDGLEGESELRNSQGFRDYAEGTLTAYELDYTFLGLAWYPQVKVLPEPPQSAQIRNVRDARIDLSGAALRIGFVFRF